jgi:hypothetical protein
MLSKLARLAEGFAALFIGASTFLVVVVIAVILIKLLG